MYAWILGVFVLSCCLILLHTYLRTDGIRLLFCCCCGQQVGSEEEEGKKKNRKERWRRTLHLPGGLLLGYVSTSYTFSFYSILFPERESGDNSKEKKQLELTKTTLFSFPHPRNQQISPASATINVEAVLVAKNISKNSKPNTGRANKSAWELRRKFKLLRDKSLMRINAFELC